MNARPPRIGSQHAAPRRGESVGDVSTSRSLAHAPNTDANAGLALVRRWLHRAATPALMAGVAILTSPAPLLAQDACCFQPAYRLQCEPEWQARQETAYRTVYDTVYETVQIPETRRVLKSRTEEREYQVAKPVVKTSTREETYTVMRPVWETSTVERQVTRTRLVTETSEREQQVTSYRPIVETHMQQRQYQVQRPVVETQMQTRAYTAMRPVTTMQTRVVDAGGYVPQTVVQPGQTRYDLQWVPRAYQTTGPLGIVSVNRGGLFWQPQTTPPTVQTQWAYRPNFVNQQVAQTQYVPEVIQEQVPVQVTRMQTETVTEQVPVQVTKMQPVTEVRRFPVTVQRPVTETVTEQVPVRRMKMVAETKTRRVPVRTYDTVYETRKEPVTVQYYETETVMKEVQVAKRVPRVEAYQRTVMVPVQRVQRIAPSYYDPFGASLGSGYSSARPPVFYDAPLTVPAESSVLSEKPAAEEPAEGDSSSLKPGIQSFESSTGDDAAQGENAAESGAESPADREPANDAGNEDTNNAASDNDPIPAPTIEPPAKST